MRLGRLAIPLTVVGVVLMLAGEGTAPAAARVREPGVVAPSPAPMNLPAGPMAMDQPETSAASGPSSESALRVSSDSATPPARTWVPLEGLYPPESPTAASFVKNGSTQGRMPSGNRATPQLRRRVQAFRSTGRPAPSGTPGLMGGRGQDRCSSRRGSPASTSRCVPGRT